MKRFIAAVALAACMLMGGCFAREQAPLPAACSYGMKTVGTLIKQVH